MPPPRNRERMVMIALAAIGLVGQACLACGAIGWLGVGLLGLLVLFVALRVEFEGDRPVGTHTTPTLYAHHFHAERAGRRAEAAAFTASARLFAYAGTLLAVIGFGLLFLGSGRSGFPELFYLFGGTLWNSVQRDRPW